MLPVHRSTVEAQSTHSCLWMPDGMLAKKGSQHGYTYMLLLASPTHRVGTAARYHLDLYCSLATVSIQDAVREPFPFHILVTSKV